MMQSLFSKENLSGPDHFHQQLVQTIVKSFQTGNREIVLRDQAVRILTQLFEAFNLACEQPLPFRFDAFVAENLSGKRETERFLSALLYGLYYRDIDLTKLISNHPRKQIQFFLLQILAENVSRKRLRKILRSLSYDALASLICYIYLHYREGSYIVSSELEKLFHNDKTIVGLLQGLRRNYFNPILLLKLFSSHPALDKESLKTVYHALEEDANKQVAGIYQQLTPLVNLMAESPRTLVDYLEGMKDDKNPQSKEVLEAQKTAGKLKELFNFFLTQPMQLEQYQEFFQLYGLHSHQPPLSIVGIEYSESLHEKMQALSIFFAHTEAQLLKPEQNLQGVFAFLYSLCYHLTSYHFHPDRYLQGLDLVTFAVPTKDRDLEKLPWLPSIIRGLKTLAAYLKKHYVLFSLSDYPVMVFDQSQGKRFVKNQNFISALEAESGCTILHISKEDAIALAQKLHLEKMIETTDEREFGYGGARNCVFFLAPLLRSAFKQGKKRVADILGMAPQQLQTLFKEAVLEQPQRAGSPAIVHMGDDDIELPETSLLADLLFAQSQQSDYFLNIPFVCGRMTTQVNPPISLKSFLNCPEALYQFTQWSDRATQNSMMGHISKPRFCLNLPFPNEEQHFRKMIVFIEPFRHATHHLAGTRYPLPHIPTDSFDGLKKTLLKLHTYFFQLGMIKCLLDPTNVKGRCVFPWNLLEPSVPLFHSLGEALSYVALETTKRDMQKRFWKNIEGLLAPDKKNTFMMGKDLEDYIQQNVDETIALCCKQHNLSPETPSVRKIGTIYKKFRKDALHLQEFLEMIRSHISSHVTAPAHWYEACVEMNLAEIIDDARCALEKKHNTLLPDWPFTYSLYQLLHAVGAGEFCTIVASLIQSYH